MESYFRTMASRLIGGETCDRSRGIAGVSMAMHTATKKSTQRDLVTVGQAAAILSVHPDTLRRWASAGVLRVYRVGPRRDRRFHRSEVARLMTTG